MTPHREIWLFLDTLNSLYLPKVHRWQKLCVHGYSVILSVHNRVVDVVGRMHALAITYLPILDSTYLLPHGTLGT